MPGIVMRTGPTRGRTIASRTRRNRERFLAASSPIRLGIPPIALVAFLVAGCATRTAQIVPPNLSVRVSPNPIVAVALPDGRYSFPFEVIIRNDGGRTARIQQVSIDVTGPFGINLYHQTMSSDEIRRLGYSNELAPATEARYRFTPRKRVPDERLFGGVAATLTVESSDPEGVSVPDATTRVTVEKGR